uniref:Uncharacterized protein n=1 Tax=Arundo donax TaxID=35708 RepID=A0A0A9GNW8_ARUDO
MKTENELNYEFSIQFLCFYLNSHTPPSIN